MKAATVSSKGESASSDVETRSSNSPDSAYWRNRLRTRGPSPFRAVEIDIAGLERYEYLASAARACKKHVETTLASVCGNRAEGHAIETRACDAWTVSDGNENDVTLIALDVFEVLQEYVLVLSLPQ